MNADALKEWRAAMGWKKQEEAADRLGMSLSAYQSAETGRRPVSRTVELACRWLEHESGLGAPRTSCDEPVAEQLVHASIEARLNAAEDAIQTILARMATDDEVLNRWHTLFKGHLSQLGERVRKIEMQPAPITESDIGMIARRAARSVLPD